MSKSDPDKGASISIIDDPKAIEKKIKRAVTDSGTEVKFDENNAGIANLMTIYSVLSGKSFADIEKEFEGKLYGHLKIAVAECVIESLRPVRERHADLMNHRDHLRDLMRSGADGARKTASSTLREVYTKMGIL